MSTNVTVRAGAKVSINARYTLTQANSEAAASPSNPYDLMADYGRASFAVRNQGMVMGSISLPHAISLSPMLQISSGQPFNITLGKDLIGSSLFNQRPAFASNLSNPNNVIVTPLGSFDTVPVPGETLVPVNYGTGPAQFTMNLRLSKSFGFGKKVERSGGGRDLAEGPAVQEDSAAECAEEAGAVEVDSGDSAEAGRVGRILRKAGATI